MRYLLAAISLLVGTAMGAGDGARSLVAWGDLAGQIHVRWLTTAPAKGEAVWGTAPNALDQRVPEDPQCLRGTTNNRDAGTGWAINHRADFAVGHAWPVFVAVQGKTNDGASFVSRAVRIEEPTQPVGSVGRARITLTVDAGDWSLPMLPLTFGVPFAPGLLADERAVRVLADDRALTTQSVAVTRWHRDQSIKWLRVDAVAPRGVRELVLEYGTQVTEPRQGTPWPPPAGELLAGLSLLDAEGTAHAAQATDLTVEETGPVKRVLRARGELGGSGFRTVVRVHEWRGVAAQRLDVTLENARTDQEMRALQSFSLRLPLSGSLQAGMANTVLQLPAGGRIFQRGDREYVVSPGNAKGERIAGVVSGDSQTAVLRNFWEQWPVALAAEEGAVLFELCPRLPAGFYANRPDEDKLYYHIRDGRHTVRQGWSKTWHLWLGPIGSAESLAGELPVVSLPPGWIEDSGALRRLAVATRDSVPGYDKAVGEALSYLPANRERRREYGMMNFGDWYGERTWNWGNLEYDTGHAWLTQFVRTGDALFQRRAEEAVRHQRDVDTRHYADDPRRVGQQWTHSMGHTAGYYPPTYKDMKVYASPGWSDNRGHVWAQGMFEHYLLGGDARSWETAKLIADWAAGPQITNFRFGNAREPGWMTKLVMAAYDSTEDPFYLHAASEMLRITHEQSLATGDHGFYHHRLPSGHCNCPADQKHEGEAGFMLGVLMTGMKMYYDATGDETVADDIAKTARFIVDTMWEPKEMGFRYTSCPHTGVSHGNIWILLEGLAFGAQRRNDAQMAEICRLALCQGWPSLLGSGKGSGFVLCNSAQGLAEFTRLPGPEFGAYRREREKLLLGPVRRPVPLLVPNPDFEDDIQGWPSRGWATERCTDVHHAGQASLRITGKVSGQNEFVNTRYDTASSPLEIRWLQPGGKYELSAWLRVERYPENAPAPSLRIAFRDANGSRNGHATSTYDLSRKGTWQRLSATFDVPEWNTRNYIALNTNTREELDVELYLDDVHLSPADTPAPEQPVVLRLDPDQAALADGVSVAPHPDFLNEPCVQGPGAAAWDAGERPAGTYQLWGRLATGTETGPIQANGVAVGAGIRATEVNWHALGKIRHKGGPLSIHLPDLAAGARVGRLVLTNVASEASSLQSP